MKLRRSDIPAVLTLICVLGIGVFRLSGGNIKDFLPDDTITDCSGRFNNIISSEKVGSPPRIQAINEKIACLQNGDRASTENQDSVLVSGPGKSNRLDIPAELTSYDNGRDADPTYESGGATVAIRYISNLAPHVPWPQPLN